MPGFDVGEELKKHPHLTFVLWVLGTVVALILGAQALIWLFDSLQIFPDDPKSIVTYLKLTILVVFILVVAVIGLIVTRPVKENQKEKKGGGA
jgi:uncharacterized BrkB/YihY/UPF0761 family membrane protein